MARRKSNGAVWLLVLWAWSKREKVAPSAVPSPAMPGGVVRKTPGPIVFRPVRGSPSDLETVWPYTLPERERRWTLHGLHDDAAPHFLELIDQAKALGLEPRIADAVRSPREQREERASKSSHVDCSWHLGGRALDIELKGKGVLWDPDYEALGQWWESKGGKWGGLFAGYGDHGDFRHFEWAPDMGYPKQHGLCDTDYAGVAAYWRKAKQNAA
jgi:hypothetical protein